MFPSVIAVFFHRGPPTSCDSGVASVFHFIGRRLMPVRAANVLNHESDTAERLPCRRSNCFILDQLTMACTQRWESLRLIRLRKQHMNVCMSQTKPQNTHTLMQIILGGLAGGFCVEMCCVQKAEEQSAGLIKYQWKVS